jgi:hypothetical protein
MICRPGSPMCSRDCQIPAKGIHELLPWNWRPQNIAGDAELMTEKQVLGLKQAPRLEQVSDEHPSECRIASIAGMMR